MVQGADRSNAGEILVVDDTEVSLNLLSDLIEVAGYTVRQAQYGEMALLSAQAEPPDLILLDIRMPGMDGYEVCRRLKADAKTCEIPIIFLSALDDTEAKLEGFRLGAVDYISKPFQTEEVLARVRTQLELRKLQLNLEKIVNDRTRQLEAEIVERTQATQELIESRHKLQVLSWHMENVREEERKRIARELHDELGQILTVQRIDLKQLTSQLDMPTHKIREKLDEVISMLDQVADTARSISENLRPGMLDMLGLAAAIKHHVDKFMQNSRLNCRIKMNQDEFDIDPRIATAVFRILQESLTNVARHAQAKNADIQVAALKDELILIVKDDGCGIGKIPAGGRRGFGLMGMQERVKLLGGEFVLESSPGNGTRIEASFPLIFSEDLQ